MLAGVFDFNGSAPNEGVTPGTSGILICGVKLVSAEAAWLIATLIDAAAELKSCVDTKVSAVEAVLFVLSNALLADAVPPAVVCPVIPDCSVLSTSIFSWTCWSVTALLVPVNP